MAKTKMDLIVPPPDKVLKNQSPNSGEQVFLEIDGLVHEYSHDDELFIVERLAKKMRAEYGWFEQISRHGPSVGSFYESLVRSALHEVLPSKIRLGTGFVYDSMRRSVSSQIDFIVYRDGVSSPIFRRDDFVIVDSSQVVSCIEVKKTLTASTLRKLISTVINSNLGSSPLAVDGVQFLNIFAFSSKVTIEAAKEIVVSEIGKHLSDFSSKTVSGETVFFELRHLVLPRIYFLDRTGYISTHCTANSSFLCDVKVSVCRSSLKGHSLGEFIVSSLALKKEEQGLSERNFLTYPLVMPESTTLVQENLRLYKKIPIREIASRFPGEVEKLRVASANGRRAYAVYVPAGLRLSDLRTLSDLGKVNGIRWLFAEPKNRQSGDGS